MDAATSTPSSSRARKKFILGVSVLVRRELDGKYLVVQEFCNQGFYMPAGIAAPGESPQEATIREAIEESGISVELTGILRVRYEPHPGQDDTVRLIVQYIGRPSSEEDEIKSVPDFESVGAAWATESELSTVRLRNGKELLRLIDMSKDPGHVWPLSAFSANELRSSDGVACEKDAFFALPRGDE